MANLLRRAIQQSISDAFDFAKVFATTLYTGTGAAQDIVSGLDFIGNGGLVWGKTRSISGSNFIQDTLRPNLFLKTDLTDAEASALGTFITSYSSNGYTLGTGSAVNNSGTTYVAWQFMEKQGFFDIVEYTGDGVAGRTVALDLDDGSAVFGMSIVKRKDGTSPWYVQHKDIAATNYLSLNETTASAVNANMWDNTTATSSALTVGTNNNGNGFSYISYNFAHNPTKGIYCGSYTGTGAVGNKITTGFPVGWVMIKKADSVAAWVILDNVRGVTDASQKVLVPNTNAAENVSTFFDTAFDVDGFTLNNQRTELNVSGGSYIFMAIADPAQF